MNNNCSLAGYNEKHWSANPRHNLTEMLHVLSEQLADWYETELYQTNVKSQGFIYRALFQTVCID